MKMSTKSRHGRQSLAPLFLFALWLSPVSASDGADAAVKDAGVPEPVAVEVVRGGGVVEVYRREGADYPAYGLDGKTHVLAPESQALQALAGASDVQFVSLAAAAPGQAPTSCAGTDCVGGFRVLGRVPAPKGATRRLALDVLGTWLREPGVQGPACLVDYGYAVTFSNAGHAWEVLLDFGCGRYRVRRDGVELAAADVAETRGEAEIDALFKAAGIVRGAAG